MNLPHLFYRFPFKFDASLLRQEIAAIPEQEWCKHPSDHKGNSALPLISTHGGINDAFDAPMQPTKFLSAMPYVRQVLSHFQTLLGRSRLMRLDAESDVPAHFDVHYHWRTHTRVHIPITTHPDIRFFCDDQAINMAEGEAWTFNSWQMHKVVNTTSVQRVHLVFDTIGNSSFWKMARPLGAPSAERFVAYQSNDEPQLVYETCPPSLAMPPGEVDFNFQEIASDAAAVSTNDPKGVRALHDILFDLRKDWRVTWLAMELNETTVAKFALLLAKTRERLKILPQNLTLASNRQEVIPVLHSTFHAMLSADALEKIRAVRARAIPITSAGVSA